MYANWHSHPFTNPCFHTTLTFLLDAGEVLEHAILVRTSAVPAINVHKLALNQGSMAGSRKEPRKFL